MDAAIRLQIWSDLYEMERMYGRPATYVQMRAQQFNPQTGKYDEDYLGSQGNKYWRGIWMLHEVNNGSFDEMPVSLNYLRKKYEH